MFLQHSIISHAGIPFRQHDEVIKQPDFHNLPGFFVLLGDKQRKGSTIKKVLIP
jgi:hypothetical protein